MKRKARKSTRSTSTPKRSATPKRRKRRAKGTARKGASMALRVSTLERTVKSHGTRLDAHDKAIKGLESATATLKAGFAGFKSRTRRKAR